MNIQLIALITAITSSMVVSKCSIEVTEAPENIVEQISDAIEESGTGEQVADTPDEVDVSEQIPDADNNSDEVLSDSESNIDTNINVSQGRSLYVANMDAIIGNQEKENELLEFAKNRNITTLLLYHLHRIHKNNYSLTNSETNQPLADFIKKAHTQYNMKIGAIAENLDFFTNVVHEYNQSRSDTLEKIDIYNLEFEFWNPVHTGSDGVLCLDYLQSNGYTCDNDGAFTYYKTVLEGLKALQQNSNNSFQLETYVGRPTDAQAQVIADNVDRVLLHAYVKNAPDAFNYAKERMQRFADVKNNMKVSVIFSTETVFMNNWLDVHGMKEAEKVYRDQWDVAKTQWQNKPDMQDFTYYVYDQMQNIVLDK